MNTVYSLQENTLVVLRNLLYSGSSIHVITENKGQRPLLLIGKFVMAYLGIEEDGEGEEASVVFCTVYLL